MSMIPQGGTSHSINEIWLYAMAGSTGWDLKLSITLNEVVYTTISVEVPGGDS